MSTSDPKLAKLTKEVKLAERTFKNTLAKRREIRKSFLTKVNTKKVPRRPIGSPTNFKIPTVSASSGAKPVKKEMRVYLGPILETITLKGNSVPPPGKDPTADFSYDKLYDKIQLEMFWKARSNYQKKQKKLIRYLRKHYTDRAKVEVSQAENLQFLGCELDDPLSQARGEITELCEKVWKIYKNVPEPKPMEIKKLLVKTIEEAQFVGMNADENITLSEMESEMVKLIDAQVKPQKVGDIQLLKKVFSKKAGSSRGIALA